MLPHVCNGEHWICASMTKLSLNTCLIYCTSKIFKSDMYVGFEVNVKVKLDLKNVTYQSLTENVLNFKSL